MMLITLLTPVLLMGQTSVGPVSSLSGIVYDQQRATIARAEIRVVIGENLTDRNYRLLGSGVDAPGANMQVRLRYGF